MTVIRPATKINSRGDIIDRPSITSSLSAAQQEDVNETQQAGVADDAHHVLHNAERLIESQC